MKKLCNAAMILTLVILGIILARVHFTSLDVTSAYTPLPPTLPMLPLSPLNSADSTQNEITLVAGTVDVDVGVESAVRQALFQAHDAIPAANYHSISDIQTADSWLFVSVVGLQALDADLDWNLDDAIWAGLVLLRQDESGHWTGAVEGAEEFSLLLADVPEEGLDASSKQDLDPLRRPLIPASAYRFPWQSGSSMQYGVRGVHDAGFFSGWKAVDFLSDGNTGAGHAPNRLLAAASGSISYVCRDGASVAIRIGDLLYAHLLDNGNLTIGHHFNQGDEIGQLRSGSFNDNCGWASQNANWFHVHWGFPNTGSFEAGGWTLNLSDGLWRRGGETRGIYSWFEAEDEPPPGGQVKLWSLANYDGSVVWNGGIGFSNDPNANSYSLEMPSGWSVKTWREDDRGGSERCWPESVSNLQDHGWHLAVQSIEVFDSNVCPPPSCNPNSDQVALFVDGNYSGQCVVKGIGEYSNPSAIGLPNDSISSIKVGGNVRAVLCRDDNYVGGCETFTGDDADLGDNSIGNDQVSSVKVEQRVSSCNPNADQIALFVDPNYGGQCVVKNIGEYPNPSSIELPNDSISSIKVGDNVRAELCRDDNYVGGCETFTGDDPDLGNDSIGNDQVSSAKVEQRSSPCNSNTDQIALYADTNYGGDCITLDNGNYPNPSHLGSLGNDDAESVKVGSNVQATLCENDDYLGRCEIFFGDDTNLGDNDVGANVVSSVRVQSRDTTPPTGQITSPSDGDIIGACPLTVQAEVDDDQSGINRVEFHAYYNDSWHHLGDDNTNPYSWNWNCSSVDDQGLWLTIHVWDNAGNEIMDPDGYTYITLDRSLPTGQVTSPSDGAVISDCPLTIRTEANDAGSGVNLVEFHAYYDDSWHHLGDDSTSPYSWNWDCSSVEGQGVWLTIHVWDNAGNEVMDPGGYVYVTLERSRFHIFLPYVSKGA